jgi:hypothetical protein
MGTKNSDEGIQHVINTCNERIQKYGFTCMGIGADVDAQPPKPPFTYTVGLTQSYGHPELIVFGLPFETAMGVLAEAARRIRSGELVCKDGGTDHKLLQGYPATFRAIPSPAVRKHMKVARVIEGDDIKALQIIWPDAHGRFPWETGADPAVAPAQPLLYQSLH